MILSSISLKNVRNHADIQIQFEKKLNYIIGGNGKGKTTILESIYYLCTTKSSSTKTDAEAVRFGEEEFIITGFLEDITKNKVSVYYNIAESKKQYLMNDKQISRPSTIIGKFPVVMLSPADHAITQGTPGERRRFIDSVISQASNTYLNILIEYNRTLRQRSALLARFKESKDRSILTELNAWDERLVKNGTELIKHRMKFLSGFNSYLISAYYKVMGKEEIPAIRYIFLEDNKGGDIEESFYMLLEEYKESELKRAANLVGPHRDDFIFEINGENLRIYGSQGQHKTFQAALRFAEFFYLKDISGITPIFLLDDVFGELDSVRANKISGYLSEVGQAFITLTDFGNLSFLNIGDGDKIIKILDDGINYA
jgi:DNA replication and repair protein RecF